MKLNIGCGKTKNEGYINIDCDPSLNPDLVLDVAQQLLPHESCSVDEVTMFHTMEHIGRSSHPTVIGEINRVLRIGGTFLISYPAAEIILKNYLENKQGMREYWEKTIFGRCLTSADSHKCLILTDDFQVFLQEYGFGLQKVMPEVGQAHNIVIQAQKTFSVVEMTDLLQKELAL